MQLTFLGTGTSDGIPIIGCTCLVCQSQHPYNKRLRTALYLQNNLHSLLLDAGPDLRQQALIYNITYFDAILISHSHSDHTLGLAEMRRFNQLRGNKAINLYANAETIEDLYKKFDYYFTPKQLGGGIAQMNFVAVAQPFTVANFTITPIPVWHGNLGILGYRINNMAFITDASFIPPSSLALLQNLDLLVLNALRYKEHSTHFNLQQAVAMAQKIDAKQTYFIHFTHDIDHQTTSAQLPKNIYLAYDGLKIEI